MSEPTMTVIKNETTQDDACNMLDARHSHRHSATQAPDGPDPASASIKHHMFPCVQTKCDERLSVGGLSAEEWNGE